MVGYRRLTDAQLAGYQQAADTIFHQIALYLRRKMLPRFLEPFQNPQSPIVGDRSQLTIHFHIDN